MELTGTLINQKIFHKKVKPTAKSLRLDNHQLESLDLAALSHCTNIAEIHLSLCSLTSLSLAPLQGLPLQTLSLFVGSVTQLDLTPLTGLPQLQKLSFFSKAAPDLSPLGQISSLTEVTIYQGSYQTIDLSPLRKLKNLRNFGLTNCPLSTIDLSPLEDLPLLEIIYIATNPSLKTVELTPLTKMRSIHSITLPGNPMLEVDLTPIVSLPLRWFNVDSSKRAFIQTGGNLSAAQARRFVNGVRHSGDVEIL